MGAGPGNVRCLRAVPCTEQVCARSDQGCRRPQEPGNDHERTQEVPPDLYATLDELLKELARPPEDGVGTLSSSGPCKAPFLQRLFKKLPADRCELPLCSRQPIDVTPELIHQIPHMGEAFQTVEKPAQGFQNLFACEKKIRTVQVGQC